MTSTGLKLIQDSTHSFRDPNNSLILVHKVVYYSRDERHKNVLHDLKVLSARTLVSH